MNDFTPTFMPKTDLATEIHEFLNKNSQYDPDGITSESMNIDGLDVSDISITNENGANKVGKPIGKYTTVTIGKLSYDGKDEFRNKCTAVSKKLCEFIPESGSCLFAGLGNRRITADASGPEVADRFLVTRHIKESGADLFSAMGLRETMCVATDVLGNTGIEAAEILRGVISNTHPDFLVVVDSLATSKMDRLATTVQICNTGISPGSGVNNSRCAINEESMGIPVIALGIPTVADICAVVADFLTEADSSFSEKKAESLVSSISRKGSRNRFVTPKDADAIIRSSSRLIAYALNLSLHRSLDYDDMCELVRQS